ncbi:MAG: hypothetical protein FWC68_03440 [Oscillospiraceae bacterium]|nr:hypothetical protein [Oscillospiraceae bacterium]
MDAHAVRYYEAIRNRKSNSDVESISKNTNISKSDVLKAKQHIFLNYNLNRRKAGKNVKVRFDPSYDMAVSWQNLIEGGNKIREMDLVLLRHEIMEQGLMVTGMSYEDAHMQAQAIHNYSKYVIELDLKEGIR